jgi:hypothetical protein
MRRKRWSLLCMSQSLNQLLEEDQRLGGGHKPVDK